MMADSSTHHGNRNATDSRKGSRSRPSTCFSVNTKKLWPHVCDDSLGGGLPSSNRSTRNRRVDSCSTDTSRRIGNDGALLSAAADTTTQTILRSLPTQKVPTLRHKRERNAACLLLSLVLSSWYVLGAILSKFSYMLEIEKESSPIAATIPRGSSVAGADFSFSDLDKQAADSSSSYRTSSTATGKSASGTEHGTAEQEESAPKLAYAWLLGGMPSQDDVEFAYWNKNTPSPAPDAHLGLIYNVLVSIKILKDSGSKADFVVMVQMASQHGKFPVKHIKWFTELGVIIKHVPPSPSYVNEQSTIPLEKFRILDWVEYDRVLYMSPDTMPFCNLDYIMELSLGDNARLQPNFIVSIGRTPASGDFFMLQPAIDAFQQFLHILTKRKHSLDDFSEEEGFGVNMKERKHSWRALSSGLALRKDLWNFEGADSDQGLLLHYTKYVHGNVSIVIRSEVEHYKGGHLFSVSKNNMLRQYSCLPKGDESTYGYQSYPSQGLRMVTSPEDMAPYRDFAQWHYSTVMPWHVRTAPPRVSSFNQMRNNHQYWFHVVRQLDVRLGLGLQFNENEFVNNEDELKKRGKHKESNRPNWRSVPMMNHKSFDPLWSIRIQSLSQWAFRLEKEKSDEETKGEPKISFRQESLSDKQVEIPSVSSASLAKSNNLVEDKEKRAFVCVTGQLERLELENKIHTIFRPLQRDGYLTEAALVLSGGGAEFTNRKYMTKDGLQPFYYNFSDAVKDLQSNSIRVLSVNGTYDRLENPPLNKKYVELMHRDQNKFRSLQDQVERSKNHARIFESCKRCLTYANNAAVVAGFHNSSEYYQVFIRIRDDAALSIPLDQMGPDAKVMSDTIPPPPNSVIVTECRSWYGMNDRMAIVAPDVAHLYFTRPFDVLARGLAFDDSVVRNPESFLLNVYTTSNINVLGHPDLKQVTRVVKQNGKAVLFEWGKRKDTALCPKPFTYLRRNYKLYGWGL